MAKLIVQHNMDPGIAIILEEALPGNAWGAPGWHGVCTECGWPLHRWTQSNAIESAKTHVNRHESGM